MKKLLLQSLFLFAFGAIALSQTTIDLRGNTEPYCLSDTLTSASGSIDVILDGGMVYEIGSKSVSHSMRLRTDSSAETPAVIHISNNFWMDEVDLDSIVFNGIHFIMESGKYIFNSGNKHTVQKVAFEDCRIQNAIGVWRAKSGDTSYVGSFSLNNCIVDTVGEYTLLNLKTHNGVGDISITNSTIYHTYGILKSSMRPNSVVVKNVTIYEGDVPDSWLTAMFDFSQGFGELEFTNVLIGPGSGGDTLGGLNVTDPGSITITNSYYTSDYAEDPDYPLVSNGFSAYPGTSTDLWADVTSGDFTIIDNSFDAKFSVGDPRWIPARLSGISLTAGELEPDFDPAVLSYTCELPWGTEAVIVGATPAHEGATVSGDGVIDVSGGSGTANIQILEGTISQTYSIEFTVYGLGVEDQIIQNIELYYNPMNDAVVIKNHMPSLLLENVEIFDLTGRVVKKMEIQDSGEITNISTRDLHTGLYILRGNYSDRSEIYLKFMK